MPFSLGLCVRTDGSKSADCVRLEGGNVVRSIVQTLQHTGVVCSTKKVTYCCQSLPIASSLLIHTFIGPVRGGALHTRNGTNCRDDNFLIDCILTWQAHRIDSYRQGPPQPPPSAKAESDRNYIGEDLLSVPFAPSIQV